MPIDKKNILIVLPCYSIKWGGPGRVVHDICDGLKKHFNFTILSTYYSQSDKIYPIPDGVKYVAFPMLNPISKIWRSFNPELAKWLQTNIHQYQLIHIHELWLYAQFVGARLAKKYNIPYIITPHGELDDWRLSHKQLKKKIFSALFQKKILQRAACIHALTVFEENSIYKYSGSITPVVIIPNSIPDFIYSSGVGSAQLNHRPYLLFLGRIQIIKGCLELLQAYSGWQGNSEYDLVFAGSFEGENYKNQILSWVKVNDLEKKVIFKGLVTGRAKFELLKNASLFVLPSFSEGFSTAVLEAMKIGCPLLISQNTGIQDVLDQHNAALFCDPEPESIQKGLNDFLSISYQERLEMAERSLNVFNKYYSMNQVLSGYEVMYHKFLKSC